MSREFDHVRQTRRSLRSEKRIGAKTLFGLLFLLAIIAVVLIATDWFRSIPADRQATFVGGSRCIECHQEQGNLWEGSHHDLAMDLATEATVLGDFDNQTLNHHGITSRMFRDGEKYMVHTEGPDGEMADFHVKYVFGVEPLQQFMVELDPPGLPTTLSKSTDSQTPLVQPPIGRVQVLRISWDTERKRWFHLDPPDVKQKLAPDDPLHWTGSGQNWNHMCAECHSTNLKKGFDSSALTYHTTYSEIDVSCEACHGPGSLHAEIADSKWLFWDRNHGYGLTRMKEADSKVQIEACAPCHSRRSPVAGDYACGARFDDHYSAELLTPATYYPDGQILDEVYVYGSFMQSKMYHKGIKCTDCHDPHTTKVKFEDNRLCTSCHQHDAAKYDAPGHHHHPVGSTGTLCIDCHMPETPYMDVDLRRDHSFKVPRPDLSVTLQTPNACTGCHLEPSNVSAEEREQLKYYADWLAAARDGDEEVAAELERVNEWAAGFTAEWYKPNPQTDDLVTDYATVFKLAWDDELESAQPLVSLAQDRKVAGIIRASALTWLQRFPAEEGIIAARSAIKDSDPVVRAAAVPFFQGVDPQQRVPDLMQLIDDPVRSVRFQVALVLAESPKTTLSDHQINTLKNSYDEYREILSRNGDQASAHLGIGILEERLGNDPAAEAAYRRAMKVQPLVTGPRSNLAGVMERTGRPDEARALRRSELVFIQRDADLAPNDAAIHYRLGLAHYLDGNSEKAEVALQRAFEIQPENASFGLPLALLYRKLVRLNEAQGIVDRLIQIEPSNLMFRQLRAEIAAEAAQKQPAEVKPAGPRTPPTQ